MGIVETVKGKLRSASAKGAPEDLAGRLEVAERALAEAKSRHAAAVKQWSSAIGGRQYARTPVLKDKADRLAAEVTKLQARRDQLAGEASTLEREARLPPAWRQARAELRDARAKLAGRAAALEEARRRGQVAELRKLGDEVADAEDLVGAAEVKVRDVAAADSATRAAARAENLKARRARLAQLVPELDRAYAELVRLATEAEVVTEELRALDGGPAMQLLNLGWTEAGLSLWRRAVARELAERVEISA